MQIKTCLEEKKYDDNTGEYDFTTYDVGTDSVKKDYSYDEDSLRRLKEINLTYNTTLLLHMTFDYDDHHVDASMGNATTRIYKITYGLVNSTDDFNYEYYYDDIGNIVEIIVKDYADIITEKYSYEYDSYNRLIREDIYFISSTDSTSISYTYDVLGNITNIKNYSYTTGLLLGTPISEKVLTYGNSLLGYNDTQLYTIVYKENGVQTGTTTYSYDDSGNPSNIEVSGNQYAYEYEGRRLIGVNFGTTLNTTYAYNDQGIRVYKSTNDHEYEYILDGDLVVIEIIDETDYIYYTYDVNNTLISLCYNGVEYYYLSDTQGNIIGLMDQSGDIVVEYRYDAWGNIINWDDISSNPIARINPYRYRGYRYDEELNLYYLQSRYYDPSIGRFLNIDDTSYLSDDTSSSLNLYAYAVNNPVMYSDISGEFPVLITIAAIAYTSWAVHDIYQIASGNVVFIPDDENEGGVIENSYKVQNPTVIYGYSIYLRYFSDNKDCFDGSAAGIASEWIVHNAAFDLSYIPSKLGFLGRQNEQAMHANFGKTVFDDGRWYVEIPSASVEFIINPYAYIYDIYQEIRKNIGD